MYKILSVHGPYIIDNLCLLDWKIVCILNWLDRLDFLFPQNWLLFFWVAMWKNLELTEQETFLFKLNFKS